MEKDMFNLKNKKATTIDEIKKLYGKFTIIIKDNIVFRCSTGILEEGPIGLLNYELPKYGNMNKFVVINDSVYELKPTREYEDRNDVVKHTVGKKVDIDPNCIDFTKAPWNKKN